MLKWTHVRGKIILEVNCEKGASPIYRIIANAPTIDGGEFPAVYSIHPLCQYPEKDGDSDRYYFKAEIGIEGDLKNSKLEETCNDVEAFIDYLVELTESTDIHVHGEIEVKEDLNTKIEDHFSVSTHKTFHINF